MWEECFQFESAKHYSFSLGIPVSSRAVTPDQQQKVLMDLQENSLELFKSSSANITRRMR
jgi:hypothetical protein